MRQQAKHHRRERLSPRGRRILFLSLGIFAGVFILINVILWAVYGERTYPRTSVMGTSIGGTAYGDLSATINDLELLPDRLTFTHGDKKESRTLEELGVRKDVQRTVRSANQQRSWLPIANLFKSAKLEAPIAIDTQALDSAMQELTGIFHADPVNARLTLTGSTVGIAEAKDGHDVDVSAIPGTITGALHANKSTMAIPLKKLTPTVAAADLQDDKKALEEQLSVSVTYKYNGRSKQASRDDIAAWYVQSGETYNISQEAVRNYITQVGTEFGIRVKDSSQVATTTAQAVSSRKATSITLVAQIAVKTYSYCTAVKGVDASHLPTLRTKLKSTYADSRGWSINGLVEYKEVTSGCDFTVWLSAAELMPTFGAICDSMWSCRVGPNVVLNFDRWQNASPAWNASGGALDEYRNMVINHETGHWLGFGHSYCPGAGLPAPVMQQQSIDLQGCAFNAWPTAVETTSLRQKLGI